MAKRKRLSPAAALGPAEMPADLDTKSAFAPPRRAPIADVSGDAATRSAFEEVAEELRAAKTEGRMVLRLPLSAIVTDHLVRDRIGLDDEEMAVLKDSIRARGQQTPIEVIDLGAGRYGLISGARRMLALMMLRDEAGNETGDDGAYGSVQALLRAPQDAAEAYSAMVEENEVRLGLSFYERARIAVKAAELGLYDSPRHAVAGLFAAARAPKRSKILRFATLVEALDGHLSFAQAIPEKLGLDLVTLLEQDPSAQRRLREALRKATAETAREERTVLERVLSGARAPKAAKAPGQEIAPGVTLTQSKGKITLSGARVDAELLQDLRNWLQNR